MQLFVRTGTTGCSALDFNDHLPCCRNTAVLIAALSLCFADKTHTVELCANDTVQDVKAVIEARQGKIN